MSLQLVDDEPTVDGSSTHDWRFINPRLTVDEPTFDGSHNATGKTG